MTNAARLIPEFKERKLETYFVKLEKNKPWS